MERVRCVMVLMSLLQMTRPDRLIPSYVLNDGNTVPAIALGTYLGYGKDGTPIKPHQTNLRGSIELAIELGYRHIDTAEIYGSETDIGVAIANCISNKTVTREQLFVTTKLWNTHHDRSSVVDAIKCSLARLKLDYVDLYLMHWPMGFHADYTESKVDFIESWRGLEAVRTLGLTRSIGVSNFNRGQLERLLKEADVPPAVLQIEVHPQLIQRDLVTFAQSQHIVVMGFSPFGSMVTRFGIDFPGPKSDTPSLKKIAQKYGKSTAQILLAWQVKRKIIPIPKALTANHLKENIDIFNINLSLDEIATIELFNSNTRYTLPSFWQSHPYYPFERVDNPVANPFVNLSRI